MKSNKDKKCFDTKNKIVTVHFKIHSLELLSRLIDEPGFEVKAEGLKWKRKK